MLTCMKKKLSLKASIEALEAMQVCPVVVLSQTIIKQKSDTTVLRPKT